MSRGSKMLNSHWKRSIQ